MNNYDRIINMSVDEMAEFIKSVRCATECFGMECSKCIEMNKQWLLAEVNYES